jgi:hypothetical protein
MPPMMTSGNNCSRQTIVESYQPVPVDDALTLVVLGAFAECGAVFGG